MQRVIQPWPGLLLSLFLVIDKKLNLRVPRETHVDSIYQSCKKILKVILHLTGHLQCMSPAKVFLDALQGCLSDFNTDIECNFFYNCKLPSLKIITPNREIIMALKYDWMYK